MIPLTELAYARWWQGNNANAKAYAPCCEDRGFKCQEGKAAAGTVDPGVAHLSVSLSCRLHRN